MSGVCCAGCATDSGGEHSTVGRERATGHETLQVRVNCKPYKVRDGEPFHRRRSDKGGNYLLM